MIRYALSCDHDHGFEAWFGSSSDYDDQAARGLVECPCCGSTAVRKQIMAPAVSGTKKSAPSPDAMKHVQSMMMQAAQQVRDHVEQNFDYVGDAFARVFGGKAFCGLSGSPGAGVETEMGAAGP